MITPDQLANEFCRVLNEWLTADQLAEINRRNATQEYASACASHDFCDSNQAMLDALSALGLEYEPEPSEAHDALIDRAWDIARARGFAKL